MSERTKKVKNSIVFVGQVTKLASQKTGGWIWRNKFSITCGFAALSVWAAIPIITGVARRR
jgi:hypothetical protein